MKHDLGRSVAVPQTLESLRRARVTRREPCLNGASNHEPASKRLRAVIDMVEHLVLGGNWSRYWSTCVNNHRLVFLIKFGEDAGIEAQGPDRTIMASSHFALGQEIPSSVISIVTARAGLLAMLPCRASKGCRKRFPAVVEHGVLFRGATMLFRPAADEPFGLKSYEPARVRRVLLIN